MKRSHSPSADDSGKRPLNASQILNHGTTPTLPSLIAPVSPPPRKKSALKSDRFASNNPDSNHPASLSLAAVEAGQVQADDPVELFSSRLAAVSRPLSASSGAGNSSRLSIGDWVGLYSRTQHANGHHFVIHQHDHPIAGPHYDLRLQFSDSSSLSWAIMYGLPGDPNSRRMNRNATETRVHCLWNHMIETGSRNTGSMIIWDTGEYEVLPYHAAEKYPETDDSASDTSNVSVELPVSQQQSESEKLREAFQNRKIRLRLHGTRLPKNYTISLRLSTKEDRAARPRPITPKRRRQRRRIAPSVKKTRTPSTSRSPSPGSSQVMSSLMDDVEDHRHGGASDSESVDSKTRLTNAYPGAVNSVGSIHQRRWFITLDRENSGFVRDGKGTIWRKSGPLSDQEAIGFDPFYVRGPEVERSIVTGRTGAEVLEDENVEGFIPRRGWRPILN